MDKNAVLEIISKFRYSLEEQMITVNKIILFGSYATNSQKEESDIDLVVISDSFKDKGYWERIDIISESIYKIFMPIEAVGVTSDEFDKSDSPVIEFARNGEVVYSQ